MNVLAYNPEASMIEKIDASRMCQRIRGDLLRATDGTRADLLSSFIIQLGEASAPETGLELSIVISVVYKICQIIKINANAKKSVQRAA